MRKRFVVLATSIGLFAAATAHAGHHLWDFTEAFSNASGSIQFIELFTAEDNEQNLNGFTVTSGANSVILTNLPTNLTANTWILIATPGFGALPGAVAPDYILPFGNFFPTGGGTLNYASGADIWNYGAVPTDGKLSLLRNGSTAVNTPTNFAGQQGELKLVEFPAAGTWGMVLLVGALLISASVLLSRRRTAVA
jgi:hypothetical protein